MTYENTVFTAMSNDEAIQVEGGLISGLLLAGLFKATKVAATVNKVVNTPGVITVAHVAGGWLVGLFRR